MPCPAVPFGAVPHLQRFRSVRRHAVQRLNALPRRVVPAVVRALSRVCPAVRTRECVTERLGQICTRVRDEALDKC